MAQRSFKLSDELDAELLAKAAKLDRPVSWVIVRSIEHALHGKCARAFADLSLREQVEATARGVTGRDRGAA